MSQSGGRQNRRYFAALEGEKIFARFLEEEKVGREVGIFNQISLEEARGRDSPLAFRNQQGGRVGRQNMTGTN